MQDFQLTSLLHKKHEKSKFWDDKTVVFNKKKYEIDITIFPTFTATNMWQVLRLNDTAQNILTSTLIKMYGNSTILNVKKISVTCLLFV